MSHSDDMKRAEEIERFVNDKTGWEYFCREELKALVLKALSEERARTLNSEAVQDLIYAGDKEHSRKPFNGNCACDWCYAKEKFQQFKDGK